MKSWAKRLSDHNLKVTVVQCCNWPQQCSPLSTVFDLVKQVSEYFQHIWRIQTVQEHQAVSRKKWIWNSLGWWRKSETGSGGKRISHSCCWSQRWKSGQWNHPEVKKENVFRQAATFCNLMSLWHQLEFEGCVDVFQLARLYHYSRSQKVSYGRWFELWNPSQTTSSFLLWFPFPFTFNISRVTFQTWGLAKPGRLPFPILRPRSLHHQQWNYNPKVRMSSFLTQIHQRHKTYMMSHSRKLSLKDVPSSSPPSTTWESSNTSSQPCWFGTVEKWISTERMRSGKNPHYHY